MATGKASSIPPLWLPDGPLFRHWKAACLEGSLDPDRWQEGYSIIQQGYTEPHRFYHNGLHLLRMLERSEHYASDIRDKTVVQFSIFFHDLVYVPGRPDNEKESAAQAGSFLESAEARPELIQKVMGYILQAAQHHEAEEPEPELMWFLDLDLAILGASPEEYEEYRTAIRKEYAAVPELFYKAGRSAFLERMLQLPRLYFTGHFRNLLEAPARKNMAAELQQLQLQE